VATPPANVVPAAAVSCRSDCATGSGPCYRRFVRSMHLKRHRTIHCAGKSGSGRSRIRILKFRFCGNIFKDAGNRNQHVHVTTRNGTLREVEEMPVASLDTYLSRFYAQLRKKDGSRKVILLRYYY